MDNTKIQSAFAIDVAKGLAASPKYLLSKYFYDEEGSKIFQRIMRMDEYYLTDCEYEIFEQQAAQICKHFMNTEQTFDLVEFGAGDGLKTKLLIRYLYENKVPFKYVPIDISKEALDQLVSEVRDEFPGVEVEGMNGDYFEMIRILNQRDDFPKVVLFLGSNLGNLNFKQSVEFLSQLELLISKEDFFLMGLDLQKDPRIILDAYDDKHGHTSDFNMNLLTRINRELDANFDLTKWQHYEVYDVKDGAAKSYLISKEKQVVNVKSVARTFSFEEWEPIYTEMSQKYSARMISDLASASAFNIIDNFYDERKYFISTLWQPIA
jgi:dimethylhistidine N-methyltransferase